MSSLYDNFRDAIIQIATPWGSGTGFYLHQYDLIVTSCEVVSGANQAVISGQNFPKTNTRVLFSDPFNKLAFLEAPEYFFLSKIELADEKDNINDGDEIVVIGHSYGQQFTATKAVVSKARLNWKGIDYLQVDAAFSYASRGESLIDQQQKIIGLSTTIEVDGINQTTAIHLSSIKKILDEYQAIKGQVALRCPACMSIVSKEEVTKYNCPVCGEKIATQIIDGKMYVPSATGEKIEDIISKLNYDLRISRIGENFWEIEEGSAIIRISYNQKSRYVFAYAVLCKLPNQNTAAIYEYMLKENNYLKGLSFSVMQQNILLSMMHIHEDDLHIETGANLFKSLFRKADDYDDLLIDMGAIPLD